MTDKKTNFSMKIWNGDKMKTVVYPDKLIALMDSGIKDHNGVSIFEGDIVASYDADDEQIYLYEIKYTSGEDAGFEIHTIPESDRTGCNYPMWCDFIDWMQHAIAKNTKTTFVIGNRYENPELLGLSDICTEDFMPKTCTCECDCDLTPHEETEEYKLKLKIAEKLSLI